MQSGGRGSRVSGPDGQLCQSGTRRVLVFSYVHFMIQEYTVLKLSLALCQRRFCWSTHLHKKHNHYHHEANQDTIVNVIFSMSALQKATGCLVWPFSPRLQPSCTFVAQKHCKRETQLTTIFLARNLQQFSQVLFFLTSWWGPF